MTGLMPNHKNKAGMSLSYEFQTQGFFNLVLKCELCSFPKIIMEPMT